MVGSIGLGAIPSMAAFCIFLHGRHHINWFCCSIHIKDFGISDKFGSNVLTFIFFHLVPFCSGVQNPLFRIHDTCQQFRQNLYLCKISEISAFGNPGRIAKNSESIGFGHFGNLPKLPKNIRTARF